MRITPLSSWGLREKFLQESTPLFFNSSCVSLATPGRLDGCIGVRLRRICGYSSDYFACQAENHQDQTSISMILVRLKLARLYRNLLFFIRPLALGFVARFRIFSVRSPRTPCVGRSGLLVRARRLGGPYCVVKELSPVLAVIHAA
jgi:hypothetical protein